MKRIMPFWILLLFVFSCSRGLDYKPDPTIVPGLLSPVRMNPDTTYIFISDYIPDHELVDSVRIQGIDVGSYSRSSNKVTIIPPQDMPMLTTLEFWVKDTPYSLLLMKSLKQKVIITYDPGENEHQSVQARGAFNGWTASRTVFEFADGKWRTGLLLNPGTYQYLLVIDGEEGLDPGNPDSIINNTGGYNSILTVGSTGENAPALFTDRIDQEDILIGMQGEIDRYYVFWENFRLLCRFTEKEDDGRLEIRIPSEATSVKRSFIRVWAANAYGFSNEVLIPLESGKVIEDPSLLSRTDPHTMIMYNVFVDRFCNADPSNDRPVDDAAILPQANYHGGDIGGVVQKVSEGYFNELGANTIWLSPVVLNPEGAYGFWPDPPSKFSGYHGYWPISFTRIDPRYGSAAQLHELVDAAHEGGMNLLLDFIANHVHELHPVYQQHPDWATELYLPDGSLNTERWDEYRLTTWFDVFLPSLDLSKPEVYNMLSDSALWWIKEYQLDGFRHDATKHIPEVFWRTLTYKLKTRVSIPDQRELLQIGETYGSPELISSYLSSGMLDGQFDFNVYDEALAVLIRPGESFERLDAALQESLDYYGSHNLMGYITGNQDRGRFISYAGGDLLFEEDAKLAGWTRDIGVGNPVAYDKLAMLFAFNMSIPGIPVIYYGDEIGMPGGNDPDSRRMMRFEGLNEREEQLKEKVAVLAGLRTGHMAMIYGDLEVLALDKDVYVIARTYFEEIVITVFNKSSRPAIISFTLPERYSGSTLRSSFGGDMVQDGREISVNVEGNGYEVLLN